MNDKQEFIHARDLAIALIEELPDSSEHDLFVKNNARLLIRGFFERGALSKEVIQVFAISFTRLEDSRSQWAIYGDYSKGVALGFSLSHLRAISEKRTLITFASCIYELSKKRELLSQVLDTFNRRARELLVQSESEAWAHKRVRIWGILFPKKPFVFHRAEFDEWNSGFFRQEIKKRAADCAEGLLRLCALCKHAGFEEEKEWRLVFPLFRDIPGNRVARKLRMVNGVEKPYIECSLDFVDPKELHLSKILLGPLYSGPLPAIGESEAEVSSSQIPLQ